MNKKIASFAGFFLIEIVIALSIFGLIGTVLAVYQNNIVFWQHEARCYAQATTLASNSIEKMQLEQSVPPSSLPGPNDYMITMRHLETPVFYANKQLALTKSFLKDFNVVELSITWKNRAGVSRTISLNTSFIGKR